MALTIDRLKECLIYVPETGVFTWLVRPGNDKKTNICNAKFSGKRAGTIDTLGYVKIWIDRKQYRAHRLAWLYMTGEWPPHDVDHANMQRDDNRWMNLRSANKSQNGANRSAQINNSTGAKGVTISPNGNAWHARIQVAGKQEYLGS